MKKQPAKITLEEWAEAEYGDHSPNLDTLRRWARDGMIVPAPEKVGRTWFVRREAQYVSLTTQRAPSARHVSLPACNDATVGKRLIDRIRA